MSPFGLAERALFLISVTRVVITLSIGCGSYLWVAIDDYIMMNTPGKYRSSEIAPRQLRSEFGPKVKVNSNSQPTILFVERNPISSYLSRFIKLDHELIF